MRREAGATPGGCIVPLLVQMPILLALFQLLNDPAKYLPAESALASEFSSATFLGMDLGTSPSQAFQQGFVVFLPYLLMLLLMVGTQYVQQWHAQPPRTPTLRPRRRPSRRSLRILRCSSALFPGTFLPVSSSTGRRRTSSGWVNRS